MKTKQQRIGFEFEEKVYKFLKDKYPKVEWLSKKNHQSKYDFKIEIKGNILFIESKFIKKGKPILRKTQFNADFVAINKNNKIKLIPNKNFTKFLKLFDNNKSKKYAKAEYGKGVIRKYGSYVGMILINKDWMEDMGFKEGDLVDISELRKEAKK